MNRPEPDPTTPGAEPDKRVDETWKKRVQDERKTQAPGPEATPGPPSFSSLVSSLGLEAMMHLGLIRDSDAKEARIDPAQAQYIIDLLGILEEKTKGNLSPEENDVLRGTLGELRMVFVEVVRALEKQGSARGSEEPPKIIH